MEKVIIPYQEAIKLLDEGDVLLFRGTTLVSKLIGAMTETPYSHVAVIGWANGNEGIWKCIEFREGSFIAGMFNSNAAGGGRSINLQHVVEQYSGNIDVYRPIKVFDKIVFNPTSKKTRSYKKTFNGKKVTRIMEKMTGLPYGWRRIWWMIRHKLIFLRWFNSWKDDLNHDELQDIIYPVCSTAVAYAFNSNGYDLVHNRSDQWTEPGDIAKSPRLNYLFTLQ
jgi:hypothetical protein